MPYFGVAYGWEHLKSRPSVGQLFGQPSEEKMKLPLCFATASRILYSSPSHSPLEMTVTRPWLASILRTHIVHTPCASVLFATGEETFVHLVLVGPFSTHV
jgi:hypothetical protein